MTTYHCYHCGNHSERWNGGYCTNPKCGRHWHEESENASEEWEG